MYSFICARIFSPLVSDVAISLLVKCHAANVGHMGRKPFLPPYFLRRALAEALPISDAVMVISRIVTNARDPSNLGCVFHFQPWTRNEVLRSEWLDDLIPVESKPLHFLKMLRVIY